LDVLCEPVPAQSELDAGSPLAGKRIVIVEDDDDGREVLGLILREARVELQSFDCASDAYNYLVHASVSEQPDALISDIAMPDEDGYAFIRRVRDLEGHEHRPHLMALALDLVLAGGGSCASPEGGPSTSTSPSPSTPTGCCAPW